MNFFTKKNQQTSPDKTSENSNWNEDFKRNKFNKTDVTQQGFDFKENTDTIVLESNKGTKKGLSYNLQKITQDQVKILKNCSYENTAAELIKILNRTNKTKFKQGVLNPLIDLGFFELTIPDKPTSPKQKYRSTGKFVARRQ